jgi:rubrerythrin
MPEIRDAKTLANYFECLSIFENETYLLYQNLSEKTDTPQIKNLLETIAKDSQRHSKLINDIAKSISETQLKPKDCSKNLGPVWKATENFRKEIAAKQKITEAEYPEMIQKLNVLESSFGEEYFILTQMKTMKYLAKEINESYKVDVDKTQKIFEAISLDEDHHREILAEIKEQNEAKQAKNNDPAVKFQNPDAWFKPLPAQTNDSY